MDIKILGPGCAKCNKTEKLVREVVKSEGIDAEITKVTDLMEIAGYGVVGTPGVVVDGIVKLSAKVPNKKDILGWIKKQ